MSPPKPISVATTVALCAAGYLLPTGAETAHAAPTTAAHSSTGTASPIVSVEPAGPGRALLTIIIVPIVTLTAALVVAPGIQAVAAAPPAVLATSQGPLVTDERVAPSAVGTPLVRSTTVSAGIVRLTLSGGYEGDRVFAINDDTFDSSSQEAFAADGTATVELPVASGVATRVEFHVFPRSGQGSIAFVFSQVVDLWSTSDYAFRLAGLTFTDSPRTAHVQLAGLLPDSPVRIDGGLAEATGTTTADGDVTIDVALRAGLNPFQIAHETPSGPQSILLQIDSQQEDNPGSSPAPRPEAPAVTVDERAGSSLLTVTGRGSSPVVVRDASGRIIAGAVLSNGTVRIIRPTPSNETHLSIMQTIDGVESAARAVVLAEASASLSRPARRARPRQPPAARSCASAERWARTRPSLTVVTGSRPSGSSAPRAPSRCSSPPAWPGRFTSPRAGEASPHPTRQSSSRDVTASAQRDKKRGSCRRHPGGASPVGGGPPAPSGGGTKTDGRARRGVGTAVDRASGASCRAPAKPENCGLGRDFGLLVVVLDDGRPMQQQSFADLLLFERAPDVVTTGFERRLRHDDHP